MQAFQIGEEGFFVSLVKPMRKGINVNCITTAVLDLPFVFVPGDQKKVELVQGFEVSWLEKMAARQQHADKGLSTGPVVCSMLKKLREKRECIGLVAGIILAGIGLGVAFGTAGSS